VTAPLIALIGNPNTGKTTLFNELTGARARVGNYPGITVERRSGRMLVGDDKVELLDLPGAYSLSARSPEEQIAIEATLGLDDNPQPDLVVAVVDAGQLLRNLYLVVQLIELQVPLVIALNMMDEVAPPPSPAKLSELFGVPVVPLVARKREGLDELARVVERALEEPPFGKAAIDYPQPLLDQLDTIIEAMPETWRIESRPGGLGRSRALALWALNNVDEDDELGHIPEELRARCLTAHEGEHDVDLEIVTARYRFLDANVPTVYPRGDERDEKLGDSPNAGKIALSDRIDRFALHPRYGFVIFIALMTVLFQALFTWSAPAIDALSAVQAWLAVAAKQNLPPGFLSGLIADGIIGGVGNVVVFLPQILLLFLILGLLEDSGYMARAAYLMDRLMKAVGLHGRAFVPMLSGCACAIPAIMATRTMERRRDRLLTMLVIPLMTCSARLPVYTLIIATLFPVVHVFGFVPLHGLLMVFMYLFSTVAALAAAAVIGRTVVKGRRMPLLMELPPYRLPTLRSVFRQMFERAGVFLKEAGTVIMGCTIVLWMLLSYPAPLQQEPLSTQAVASWQHIIVVDAGDVTLTEAPDVVERADNSAALAKWEADRLSGSYGGKLGKLIEPLISPLGFDWKLGVGIIGAFAAREVFVSTMGLVYGIGGEVDEESEQLHGKIHSETHADGRRVYTPLVGLSLMIFFALACQCMSTLAVVKRETRSYKWPAFLFAYMTTLAWLVSLLVYQGGKLLGFA
jgi:ferrous iron transport protein B